MKIKKPKWIDDNPHRAGKRLSNIYWGEYPVWKRDEEVLKWSDLDKEMIIYSHTFIYMHRGTELSRESFKTQGSQNVVYHIPTGYILKDSTFKPKPHGVNRVEIVKESYKLKFKLTHPNIATPIEIVIKKPENVTMTVADARNEIIANPGFPSGYDVDITNFNEFPDELVVNNDFSFNVPLKVGTAVPKPVKKVTIKYYLVDDNGDQTVYKTETGRYLDGSFDYNISIPVGYEQTNRVDNTATTTSIYIKVKVFNVYIRMATYKNGNINQVWHSYNLTRKYNETVSQSDLQALPDNLKVGTAPNLFKVTLSYPDGFVFNTRTITEDTNIDIAIKASLKMIELLSEVDVPRITEAGIGVYTYGLPTGIVKPGSVQTVKMKFIANSIGLENGEKAFAAIFPYNPVKQTIIGNGFELVTNKTINLSVVNSSDFVQKLKTEFSGVLNGIPNDIPKTESILIASDEHVRSNQYSDFMNYWRYSFDFPTDTYMYVTDQFNKDEINNDRTLVSKWNYRCFDKEFDWTLLDTTTLDNYDKNNHKCWIIISNIVLHQFPEEYYNNNYHSPAEYLMSTNIKCIAAGLPTASILSSNIEIEDRRSDYPNRSNSIHGTLPTVQIYECFIDRICPLTIKDYRYYLCDNAKDFITDVEYKLKTIEDLHGTSDKEGYNRNIITNDVDERKKWDHGDIDNRYKYAYSNYNNISYGEYKTNFYLKREDYIPKFGNNYTSIYKDNPLNYSAGFMTYFTCFHRAQNWWKDKYREDLIAPELLEHVKKNETNMICFNFWDMVNHAIAKSLQRNHIVDNRMLTVIEETDKNAVIKVNMHLLPVCIDVEDAAFPPMSVDMKEKDFGNQSFADKNPIIVYSPVNVKRVLNNIPRVTLYRENGDVADNINTLSKYNPYIYISSSGGTDSYYKFKYFYNKSHDQVWFNYGGDPYRFFTDEYIYKSSVSPATNSGLIRGILSKTTIYKGRPPIFYSTGDSSYTTMYIESLFKKSFKVTGYDYSTNFYKLRKNVKINPLISFKVNYLYDHNKYDLSNFIDIASQDSSYTHYGDSMLYTGFNSFFVEPKDNYSMIGEGYSVWTTSKPVSTTKGVFKGSLNYDSLTNVLNMYNPKIREIIDYNNSITIFDNWKEEVSYDNPQ